MPAAAFAAGRGARRRGSRARPMSRHAATSRRAAALAVRRVLDGATLPAALAAVADDAPTRGHALVQELAYGTLRHWGRLAALAAGARGQAARRPEARRAGRGGALPARPHARAAVCRRRSRGRCRRARCAPAGQGAGQRDAAPVPARTRRAERRRWRAASPVARWSYPRWWIGRVEADHPAHWRADPGGRQRAAAADAAREPPGDDARRAARALRRARASTPTPVGEVGHHRDASRARWPSCRASPKARSRCRTPARSWPRRCSSVARRHARARRLRRARRQDHAHRRAGRRRAHGARRRRRAPARGSRENLERLRLASDACASRSGDAGDPAAWWDGRPFDRILADVPCTASGIVRRHPDGKWLRRKTDIASFAAQQRRILAGLWPLLAPGGLLLYATCSVFAAENELQISEFLQDAPGGVARNHQLSGRMSRMQAANSCLRGTAQATIRTASSTRCSARADRLVRAAGGRRRPPSPDPLPTSPIAGMPSLLLRRRLLVLARSAACSRRARARGHHPRSSRPSCGSRKARCCSTPSSTSQFNPTLEEALQKGIPLYFVLEFELTRSRWYWLDEKVAQTVAHVARVVQRAHAAVPSSRSGLLAQTFNSLEEVERYIGRVTSRPVASGERARRRARATRRRSGCGSTSTSCRSRSRSTRSRRANGRWRPIGIGGVVTCCP